MTTSASVGVVRFFFLFFFFFSTINWCATFDAVPLNSVKSCTPCPVVRSAAEENSVCLLLPHRDGELNLS